MRKTSSNCPLRPLLIQTGRCCPPPKASLLLCPPPKAGQALLYLVNDSRARPPEAHAVLGTCSRQEIIHFLVYVLLREINNQGIRNSLLMPPSLHLLSPITEMLALERQALSWRPSTNNSQKAWMLARKSQLAGPGERPGNRDGAQFCDTWPGSRSRTNPFPPHPPGLGFLICRRVLLALKSLVKASSKGAARHHRTNWDMVGEGNHQREAAGRSGPPGPTTPHAGCCFSFGASDALPVILANVY